MLLVHHTGVPGPPYIYIRSPKQFTRAVQHRIERFAVNPLKPLTCKTRILSTDGVNVKTTYYLTVYVVYFFTEIHLYIFQYTRKQLANHHRLCNIHCIVDSRGRVHKPTISKTIQSANTN